jgi:hypothetical protein
MRRLIFIAFITAASLEAQPAGAKTFATPEEASSALVQAAKNGADSLIELLGPQAAEVLHSGDPVEDKKLVQQFNERAAQKMKLVPDELNGHHMEMLVGEEDWPVAIPLVEKNGKWYFDVLEGKAEIRRRVIGGNELDVIEICHGYVEAQELYAKGDWTGKGVHQYASKIISSPGKKDGLYWPGGDSPVAEGFAKAVAAGYQLSGGEPKPFHGYYFKILMGQGPDAMDGDEDYLVHGLMIGGFALIAWPAEYGVSGIMTFIVNQDGDVYQKDLGARTGVLAKTITKFNPDRSWTMVPEQGEQLP